MKETSTMTSNLYRPYLGMILMALAMFSYTTTNAFLKFCDQVYPSTQVLCFRYIFALFPCVFFGGGRQIFCQRQVALKTYALRGLASATSLSCLFASIYILPFSDAIVLMFIAPLFMVLLSPFLLREHITQGQWLAVIVGLVGVIIMAGPTRSNQWMGVIMGALSALLEAALLLNGRKLTRFDNSAKIVFYSTLFGSLIGLATLFFYWIMPTPKDWVFLIFLGLGGGLGHYLQTLASRYATAGTLGPMIYTAMIWSVFYSYFFFCEPLTWALWIGGGLIVVSGFWVVRNGRSEEVSLENRPS